MLPTVCPPRGHPPPTPNSKSSPLLTNSPPNSSHALIHPLPLEAAEDEVSTRQDESRECLSLPTDVSNSRENRHDTNSLKHSGSTLYPLQTPPPFKSDLVVEEDGIDSPSWPSSSRPFPDRSSHRKSTTFQLEDGDPNPLPSGSPFTSPTPDSSYRTYRSGTRLGSPLFDKKFNDAFLSSRGVLDENVQTSVKDRKEQLVELAKIESLSDRESQLLEIAEDLLQAVVEGNIITEHRMQECYNCEAIMRKTIAEQSLKIATIEDEKAELKEQVLMLKSKFRNVVRLLGTLQPSTSGSSPIASPHLRSNSPIRAMSSLGSRSSVIHARRDEIWRRVEDERRHGFPEDETRRHPSRRHLIRKGETMRDFSPMTSETSLHPVSPPLRPVDRSRSYRSSPHSRSSPNFHRSPATPSNDYCPSYPVTQPCGPLLSPVGRAPPRGSIKKEGCVDRGIGTVERRRSPLMQSLQSGGLLAMDDRRI